MKWQANDMSSTWSRFPARFLGQLEIRGLGYQLRVPKLRVPPRVPAKQGDEELKLAALTRDDVAKRLDVSISTVRRLSKVRGCTR